MSDKTIAARLDSFEHRQRWLQRALVLVLSALLASLLLGQSSAEQVGSDPNASLCPEGARMVKVVLCHNGYDENDPIYSESWRRESECGGGLRGPVDNGYRGYLCLVD